MAKPVLYNDAFYFVQFFRLVCIDLLSNYIISICCIFRLSISSQIKVLSLIASIVLMKFIYHSMIGTPITSKKVDPELEESCKKSRALLSKFLLYRSENPKEVNTFFNIWFVVK